MRFLQTTREVNLDRAAWLAIWTSGMLLVSGGLAGQQHVIYSLPQVPPPGIYSASLLGDTDGDTIGDFAYLSPTTGNVEVIRGADGVPISSFAGAGMLWFAPIGDVNGDGLIDILRVDTTHGRVLIAPSWTQLYSYSRGGVGGIGVNGVGDVDGDGLTDIGVSYPAVLVPPATATGVTVYSGLDGSLLTTVISTSAGPRPVGFGAAGDMNQDGFGDIFLIAPAGPTNPGRVWVLSGATGIELNSWSAPSFASGLITFGASVVAGEDVDGDGASDLAVEAIDLTLASGTLHIYSGATGATIRSVPLPVYSGTGLAMLGDVNGDGMAEIAFGMQHATHSVQLIDGATGVITPIGGYFGNFLTSGGDLTGDGIPDMAIVETSAITGGGPAAVIKFLSPVPLTSSAQTQQSPGCGPVLSLSAPPTLETTLTIDLTGSLFGTNGVLMAGPPIAPLVVGLNCPVFLDPFFSIPVAPFTVDPVGSWSLPVTMPRHAHLGGVALTLQAVLLPTPAAGLQLTNGLFLTFGY